MVSCASKIRQGVVASIRQRSSWYSMRCRLSGLKHINPQHILRAHRNKSPAHAPGHHRKLAPPPGVEMPHSCKPSKQHQTKTPGLMPRCPGWGMTSSRFHLSDTCECDVWQPLSGILSSPSNTRLLRARCFLAMSSHAQRLREHQAQIVDSGTSSERHKHQSVQKPDALQVNLLIAARSTHSPL